MSLQHFKQLDDNINDLQNLNFDFDKLSALEEKLTQSCNLNIIEAAEKEVQPDSDEGKNLIDKFSIIRNIGYKLLNSIKIEFKISFCGVVLCHLEIPKLNKNEK